RLCDTARRIRREATRRSRMSSAFRSTTILSEWHTELTNGEDQQHEQDDDAPGIRVPGSEVLQAEDPGDPREEIRIGRRTVNESIAGLRAQLPDEPKFRDNAVEICGKGVGSFRNQNDKLDHFQSSALATNSDRKALRST